MNQPLSGTLPQTTDQRKPSQKINPPAKMHNTVHKLRALIEEGAFNFWIFPKQANEEFAHKGWVISDTALAGGLHWLTKQQELMRRDEIIPGFTSRNPQYKRFDQAELDAMQRQREEILAARNKADSTQSDAFGDEEEVTINPRGLTPKQKQLLRLLLPRIKDGELTTAEGFQKNDIDEQLKRSNYTTLRSLFDTLIDWRLLRQTGESRARRYFFRPDTFKHLEKAGLA